MKLHKPFVELTFASLMVFGEDTCFEGAELEDALAGLPPGHHSGAGCAAGYAGQLLPGPAAGAHHQLEVSIAHTCFMFHGR